MERIWLNAYPGGGRAEIVATLDRLVLRGERRQVPLPDRLTYHEARNFV